MQKLFNLLDWASIGGPGAEEKVIVLKGGGDDKPRNVYLDVNAPNRVRLDVIAPDGETYFLASVEGRDKLHFVWAGEAQIASSGEVYIQTDDGVNTHTPDMGEATFTRLHERRIMSPAEMQMRALALENKRQMEAMFENQLEAIRDENARFHIARQGSADVAEAGTPVAAPDAGKAGDAGKSAAGDGKPQGDSAKPAGGDGAAAKTGVSEKSEVSGTTK